MEPVKDALRRILSKVPRKSALVIYAMPREQAITRVLQLPSVKPDEVAQMVALSSQTQLPFPRDQAVVDFQVIDQQAGSSTVQLVACHREVVERSLALFRQEGLEPAWIVPSSWGCLAWYQRLGRSSEVREPVLLMDIDEDHAELALIRQDRLIYSRSLGQGFRVSQSGTDVAGLVAQELERSLFSLSKEVPDVAINSGIVTGLGPLEPWQRLLEQRLGKPVFIRPAFGTLSRAVSSSSAQQASPVVALGLAMAEASWLINLLPQDVRHAQQHQRRMRELALTGALVVSSLLAGAWLLSIAVTRQTRVASQSLHQVKQLETV
ncbi:MAG: pilus assembly protein PilM, partial [Candidatus Omnitrophica bacterium]|nr:pilus assembly protein PilM [Candidatus Omnitrophota bacterium]